MRNRTQCIPLSILATALLGACGSSGGDGDPDASTWEPPPGPDAVDDALYHPWAYLPSTDIPAPRDWQLQRGIIHLHSTYSHDACDGEPFVDGVRNEQCFDELRDALCVTQQDFAFLTDHDDLFAYHEYPDVLLYAEGDTLIERGGLPVANVMHCDDGHDVVIAAGTESGSMPIGLEHHVGETLEERMEAYNDVTHDGVQAYRDAGALALVQHTEEWEVETLLSLPLDGIEIYNLHYNMIQAVDVVVIMIIDSSDRPWRVPVPELAFVPLFRENPADMEAWSRSLAVRRQVGIIASDIHRNAFAGESLDSERYDSYRRLMHWFSNHVLTPPGPVDDASLKEAIGHGRLYGAFEAYGYPMGFDFHATTGATVYEMGDDVPGGVTVQLHLTIPTVYHLDPDGPQPVITGRILRSSDGDWDEVVSDSSDITYEAGPGVYRAEIRIIPEHTRPWLGTLADEYLADDKVWIYSNPIYVDMTY